SVPAILVTVKVSRPLVPSRVMEAIINPSGLGRTGTNKPEAFVHKATGSGVSHWVRVTNCCADLSLHGPYESSSGVTPQRPIPNEPFALAAYITNLSSGKNLVVFLLIVPSDCFSRVAYISSSVSI